MKEEYPDLSHKDVVSVIAQIWNQMGTEERQPYEEKSKRDQQIYEQELEYFYSRHPEERPKNSKKKWTLISFDLFNSSSYKL